MQAFTNRGKILRVIDANINRSKEGLRVCEEVARFILDSRVLTSELKKVRHKIDTLARRLPGSLSDLLEVRNSRKDVGIRIYVNELERQDPRDIFFANMQRVKESVRVLEEFSKLTDKRLAVEFKNIRYGIYGIEKKAAKRIFALFDTR